MENGHVCLCRRWYSPLNETIVNVVLCDLELNFEGHKFEKNNILEMVRTITRMPPKTYRSWYLPSNGNNVKVILHDVDLHFKIIFLLCIYHIKLCMQLMSLADLPWLAQSLPLSCSYLFLHLAVSITLLWRPRTFSNVVPNMFVVKLIGLYRLTCACGYTDIGCRKRMYWLKCLWFTSTGVVSVDRTTQVNPKW